MLRLTRRISAPALRSRLSRLFLVLQLVLVTLPLLVLLLPLPLPLPLLPQPPLLLLRSPARAAGGLLS